MDRHLPAMLLAALLAAYIAAGLVAWLLESAALMRSVAGGW